MNNDKNRQIVPLLDEKAIVPRHRIAPETAITGLIPKDPFDGLVVIGVIAGIVYYVITKDTWLLVTFLSLLTGGAIEKKRQALRDKRKI